MNISFLERFKRATSVTLIFVVVFSTLTPAVFALTSWPSNPTTTATDNTNTWGSVGTRGWTNHGNITTSNNSYAVISGGSGLNAGEKSVNLKATGFGFAIPVGATIQGISVSVERKQQDNGSKIEDYAVRLTTAAPSESATSAQNKANIGTEWTDTDTTVVYGGTADTWGNSWTPAQINHSSFGVFFAVTKTAGGSAKQASVDHISVTVTYSTGSDTTAPVISQVTAVPSPTADTTPNYTFTTNEAGTISYTGDCSSSTTTAVVESNTITFNTLAAGVHSNCTVRVTDASSNASNILSVNSFTVDTAAPLLSLPSNITQEATSNAGATVTFSATSTDVDPANPTVTCTPSSGSTFPIATTTVNCSATDTVGNTSNGSFTVTVQDTTKPVITLNGGTVNLNVGDTYTEQGATATDIVDGNLTGSIVVGGAVVNTAAPGAYIVTYNVTDAHGNAANTVSRTVNVSDVTAPVISGVPADIVVEQVGNAAANVTYTNPTANDDVDGSVAVLCSPTSGSPFSYGLTSVLCNATDLASNVANASFNVTVQDTVAPTATSVVIVSNNTNNSLAKEGNTITVSFTTSEPVNTPTATIAGKTATVTNVSGNDYTATYTLTAAETQGPATIAIDFADIVGNNATQVTATTDSSSVTIDTVTPTPFHVARPSDNEVIESATTNSEGSCETGTTITISGAALQTNPTTTTCVGGQFLTPITFTSASLDTAFNLTFTETDTVGNTVVKTVNNIQYRAPVVTGGGSAPANTDFVNTNNSNPPAPTNPTPTPTNTPTQPTTPTEPTPTPTPETTPTTPTTGGTGTTGGTTPAFNPADATLDIGGAGTPEEEPVVEEATPTVDPTLDAGGWAIPEETSYTLLWTLLALIALLNTWWFFVAKNKNQPTHRRD